MEILLTGLGIMVVVLGYTTINLLKKNEKLEDLVLSRDNYVQKLTQTIDFINIKLNEIDEKGTFKSDDEIGFFFKQIQNIQDILNEYKI
jgi:hypothetical protein